MADEINHKENLKSFYKATEEFGNTIVKEKSSDGILSQGLNVLMNFPSTIYVAYYILNQETFEFEFNQVHPDKYKNEVKNVFQKIIDTGTLGKSLQSGSIGFFNDDDSDNNKNFLICPIVGSGGVIALVLIKVTEVLYPPEHHIYHHVKMFSILLGVTTEKIILQDTQSRTQEMLDQMVATRTMKLAQSKVQLGEKIESLKSDLTMTMPHEVRTPINQILGFSDYLIKTFKKSDIKDAEDYLEIVTDIHISAERLKRLFENYLFYAKLSIISTNVFEIQNLKKDITPSVQPVIYDKIMISIIQAGRQDDLKIELSDSPIAMNEEYINKIVEEIIGNCIKYSEASTGIEVFSFVKDKNYIITFIDHGRGMTNEQIQSIDAYVQFDRRAYEQQGSGLGLSIVQKILDLHEGDFAVESDPGNYTRVMIKLPVPVDYDFEN
ncbi:MAG: HAMP domain-containing histidine kinase [Ignavibacteriae bacterium]|nr:HAMP domain-containing histidine kinase [Ignavibacteriota bacterium]